MNMASFSRFFQVSRWFSAVSHAFGSDSVHLSVEKSVPCGFRPSFTLAPCSHWTQRSSFHSIESSASKRNLTSYLDMGEIIKLRIY